MLLDARYVAFLGAGPNEATAKFGAAKLFEGAQRLAFATNVEEWAHEQYFITRTGDPVVLIGPAGATDDRIREIFSELRWLRTRTVFVGVDEIGEGVVHLPLAPGIPEDLSPVIACLPVSQLGFELAHLAGKHSYNFPSREAEEEHYETIHRATVGEPV